MDVVLFGAGEGVKKIKEIFNQHNIIAIADNDTSKIGEMIGLGDSHIRIIAPSEIIYLKFDYVVVSTLRQDYQSQILNQLLTLNIPLEKIITVQDGEIVSYPEILPASNTPSRKIYFDVTYITDHNALSGVPRVCNNLYRELTNSSNGVFPVRFLMNQYISSRKYDCFINGNQYDNTEYIISPTENDKILLPDYLGLVDTEYSVAENIDNLFFGENAEMRNEINRLFQSLYRHPEKYMDIVKLLADHKKGLTRKQIAETLRIPNNGHLGDILDDLQYCDFVRMYNNGLKANAGIYQLIDFYTLFYHQFGRRRVTDIHYWRNMIGTPTQNTWYGLAYERVCMSHIRQIIYALRLDYIHTEFYSWRSKEHSPAAQIDIIIDRADGIVTICEVKYSKAEYTLSKDEYEKIMNRVEAFVQETKCKKGTQIVIITTKGMRPTGYSEISRRTIILDDLFVELPE